MKGGNIGVPTHMSLERFAGVVPLLLLLLLFRCCTAAVLRMLVKLRGIVGWNRPSLCSGWHAHIRTHAHAAPFVAVTKRP